MRRDLEKDVVGKKIEATEVRPSKNAMRAIRRHAKRKDFTDRVDGHKVTKAERLKIVKMAPTVAAPAPAAAPNEGGQA